MLLLFQLDCSHLFFICFLCSPYFRGNLNSRAGFEFKEFRLFSTIIFQKNKIQRFFWKKSNRWKNKARYDFSKKKH